MDPLIKIQMKTFSQLMSQYLGFNIILIKEPNTGEGHSLVFRLWGEQGNLSPEEQTQIIGWCLLKHPEWVNRWWKDDAFDENLLDLDHHNHLYIHETHLKRMLFDLHPARNQILQSLVDKLSLKYANKHKNPIQFLWHGNNIILLGKECNHPFSNKLSKDIWKLEKSMTALPVGSLRDHKIKSVTPLAPYRLDFPGKPANFKMDQISLEKARNLSPNLVIHKHCEIYQHQHRAQTFIVQMQTVSLLNDHVAVPLNSLNPLLRLVNMPTIDFLPPKLQAPNLIPRPIIFQHSKLAETEWHTLRARFTEGNQVTDLSSPIEQAEEPEWLTQARMDLENIEQRIIRSPAPISPRL